MQCDTKIRLRRAAVNRTEATVGSGDRTARIQMAAPSLGSCVPFGKTDYLSGLVVSASVK